MEQERWLRLYWLSRSTIYRIKTLVLENIWGIEMSLQRFIVIIIHHESFETHANVPLKLIKFYSYKLNRNLNWILFLQIE